MTTPTPGQAAAIALRNRSAIVSAGAGAGKTRTLVERVYTILAEDEPRTGVDELLVVTFSRAAVSEMRERLAARLATAAADTSLDPGLRAHLHRQEILLPRALLSTIHSFCLHVISAHPERAQLAPGFDLMDEQETRLFQRDWVLRRIERELRNNGPAADTLRDLFRDQPSPVTGFDRLAHIILSLQKYLGSLADPRAASREWLALYEGTGSTTEAEDLVERFRRSLLLKHTRKIRRAVAFHREGLPPEYTATQRQMEMLLAEVVDPALENPEANDWPAIAESLVVAGKPRGIDDGVGGRYEDLRRTAMKDAGDFRNAIKALADWTLQKDLAASAPVVRILLEELGLRWQEELMEEHLRLRRLTYTHLERLASRILVGEDGSPTETALAYRDQFRHVLVDEFQDVNALQERLLRAVSRPDDHPSGGNRFVVGDVKQSIYEFRLADPSLFLSIYTCATNVEEEGTGTARITLGHNFRSAPALLDELNRFFAPLLREGTIGIEYAEGHELAAGRTGDSKSGRPPQFAFHVLPKDNEVEAESDDPLVEARYVARMVREMGPPWRHIAVLLRSTTGILNELVEAFGREGIPFFCDARMGFLTAPEVLEVQAILQAVHNPWRDVDLLALLRGPAGEWSEDDLLELRLVHRSAPFFDNLKKAAKEDEHPLQAKAARAIDQIRRWRADSLHLGMERFFMRLYDELQLLELGAARPGGEQRRLNLLHLVDRARQFDRFLQTGLGAFLRFIEDLIANDEDFAAPSPVPESAEVVRIMTVHKSKGMQFPIVIVPFLGRQFNDRSATEAVLMDRRVGIATRHRDRAAGEVHPHYLEAFRDAIRRRSREEELRLLYVALTRAEEAAHLVLSMEDSAEGLSQAAREQGIALKPMTILRARSRADWIVPTIATRFPGCTEAGEYTDGIARLSIHSAKTIGDRLAASPGGLPGRPAPAPAEISAFGDALRRISAAADNPPRPLVRAKVSVTELKRIYDSQRDAETPPLRGGRNSAAWKPEFLRKGPGGGAERGRQVHRFLALCELIELTRGTRSLTEEGERLVAMGMMDAAGLGLVDLGAIAWFLNSDLGRRLRREAPRLHREWPFTVGIEAREVAGATAQGTIVLQGVVDLLFEEEGRMILVDYKTDWCGEGGERTGELVDVYTPQVELYALAVERVLGAAPAECWLVFLAGQQAVEVVGAGDPAGAWRRVVEAGTVVFPEAQQRPMPIRV